MSKDLKLDINLGKFKSTGSLKKTLWSISSNLDVYKPKVIMTFNENEDKIIETFKLFISRIDFFLIKTPDIKINEEKSYELCKMFCKNEILKITSNCVFYKKIDLKEESSFNCFLIPKHVQEGLEEYGQNMCDFYAKECFKYPLNKDLYFKNKSEQICNTNLFIVEEEKEEDENFTEMNIQEIFKLSSLIGSEQ